MVTYIRSDLDFILQQILIAEQHAAGADLTTLVPNSFVPFGLRTVDGSFNNLFPGQSEFGASDNVFPRMTEPFFRDAEAGTSYADTTDTLVIDAQPRIISNLIVDQTSNNPAAVAVAGDIGADLIWGTADDLLNDGVTITDLRAGQDGILGTTDDIAEFSFDNVTPDEGLSAPFNLWFVFFGQFFDHGLDLVQKGGSGTVFIPLQPDDPLIAGADGILGNADDLPPSLQFMVLTRATNQPGEDGILGDDPLTVGIDESADDIQEHINKTSPFVDQNQTYTSHPSHQVFLRAYELNAAGDPVATGKLITNRNLGTDGEFGGTGLDADTDLGGMATWGIVKAQARDLLGIELSDYDAVNVPMIRVDQYGNFIPGANGFAQLVVGLGLDGIAQTEDDVLVEGNPAAPISPLAVGALRTGNMFLADIAHSANPFDSQTGAALTADADDVVGNVDGVAGTYDDELLAEHFMAGDGRVNENIGLTAVHHVFHAEHNRLVDHTKSVLIADAAALLAGGASQAEAVAFLNEWLLTDVATVPATSAGLNWDGERLFQAAKFGTEMQYQHLVFEEFARKVQPMVDVFLAPEGFDTTINPAIVAEFAHVVYRFGHSMLLETIDRLDPEFATSEIGLIEAFLNPLAFDANGTLSPEEAAGAIVRGTTRQVGNEIDEFKTEVLRNNLLGLPLDLAAINLARGRDTGIPSLNAARREFYDMTSDSQLKPYTSWADYAQHLKHPESIINFIAAYGTHISITSATTLADKRAAATLLVFGDGDDGDGVTIGLGTFTDRFDFLNSVGTYASLASGVTTTGLDDVDLWIGGLAEKQMPFGGLLGSTFNFVFETQLENLQNGDRFYYLSRTAGMHFITELENNSFAKLVMLNTDVTRLPADIFSTPNFILEVDQTRQFTGLNERGADGIQGTTDDVVGADGIDGNSDPVGGTALTPLVIRDNPATAGADTNYLHYTGPDHVVLGGTEGNDILIASIGDDTLWGDGGNDRLEGGDGVDNIEGGAGDDIITDWGGDDILKGNDGNDVIHGGNGFNLIIGGAGSDFIITGEDVSETFAGEGNDFILGAQMNLPTLGNEGDDWIEIGTSDGAGGDNFDPQEAGTIIGHDVFITGGGFDEVDGEGGDDIMVGSDGEDHFGGGGGFDWASYKFDQFGVTVDLNVNDFIEPPVTPSASGILDRFAQVEGLSGSNFSDVLRGDDADLAEIDVPGAQNSALTNIGLISGLQELLGAGVTSFASGNIILGGNGSDIIEGRGGDDLIDGDHALNVRVIVRDANNPAVVLRSVDSIAELVPDMLAGTINPGQLEIVREILPGNGGFNFDTAVFRGDQADYTVAIDDNSTPLDASDDIVTVTDNVAGRDGIDRLTNIERLQFGDSIRVLVDGLNSEPVGTPTISDDTPAVNQSLSVSAAGVTDADNPGTGAVTGGPIQYIWQVERDPVNAPGVFEDIVNEAAANPGTVSGTSYRVTADLDGLALRVKVVYQDANGVLETVFSDATAPVAGVAAAPPAATPPAETLVTSPGGGLHLIRADLQFILDQIVIAESRPDGNVLDVIANPRLPFGLRTVDGSFNNLILGQTEFGAADQNFPSLLDQVFRNDLDGDAFDANGPAPGGVVTNTNYATSGAGGNVVDADPRIISNLIVDQTASNPAAVAAAAANSGTQVVMSPGLDGIFGTGDDRPVFEIPNITPDEGLSAPFNAWFTFFGQFFDHGLDLVDKGDNGTVFIPLQADDPLIAGANGIFGDADDLPASQRFMVLTRANNTAIQAGTDGVFGTSDDVHFHNNETTPFVDQNQTYTSHASHQVFLREYVLRDIPGDGLGPVAVNTGQLLDGANGGIGNWAEVKAQAAAMLGIQLSDTDIFDVPLLATDVYGNFIPGPNGFAQLVTNLGLIEGVAGGLDLNALPGGAIAGRTGHAFLNDIAHNAVPGTVFDTDGNPATPGTSVVQADLDTDTGNTIATDFAGRKVAYDDELLDAHFITGDGRGNENIGLTSVHFIFHAEHNRLVGHIKDIAVASNDLAFLNEWLAVEVASLPTNQAEIDALQWNGDRLFQAARFGTEMQYQHLVFEEFARKVQPQVDIFLAEGQGYDTTINPAIVAEFAHVVYRFGHSMLLETVDRYDADFNLVGGDLQQIGLIEAFLNPLEFAASSSGGTDAEAAGAIVRGVTRQVGNEIDEFVTEALRNNLLGLPLDLPAINLARGRDTGVPTLNQARAEFYSWTGDSQLKPYASWSDFVQHLKHPESLVNFIAAYGTHVSITTETTTAGKRAAAYALVYGEGGFDGDPLTLGDNPTVAVPIDRLAFLNGAAATTGVDAIDLWIGGLAEKQMPFGGLLGSTFNYVFENQMEKLQNGDRFYYLERTAGLNFLTELENNSFAKLIMANTDATHLPGDVFSTPAFILEVDDTIQFTGLGPDGRDDPEGVIRNNPATSTPDPNYLEYIGEDHVVLGGTAGNDTLIASIGDDTLYGDAGNDRLEGGDGVDMILGGTGDDIITDKGGDGNLQGQDGNDAIHGGNGINLILGGFGSDFIVTGEDESEAFGGPGNDFILGVRPVEMIFGNEGDDWIEHGMADGSAGENFDTRGLDSIIGNDVFMGDTVADRMGGEGGDDIMIGNGGTGDRYLGASGFDWAVFQHDTLAANVDMNLRAFDEAPVPLSVASSLARFESVEGVSGSAFSDILRGDDADAAVIATSGFTGSVLTNFGLIDGLQEFVGIGVTSFGSGNIMLGGDGSDIIEGRGGDDLIDGDLSLRVRISVRETVDVNNDDIPDRDVNGELILGAEIDSVDSMTDLTARVFAGEINPGQLQIVREILPLTVGGPDFDTAVFSDVLANYLINGQPFDPDNPPTPDANGFYTVAHVVGGVAGPDGTDRVSHIERLQFADQSIVLGGLNNDPVGLLTIDDATPDENQLLTVSIAGVTDADNPGAGAVTGPVSYVWQVDTRADGVFEDVIIATGLGDVRATGPTFTPGDAEVGLALRVRAIYQDANGVLETVFSAPTALVGNVNDAPTGLPTISETAPTEGRALTVITTTIVDPDGTTAATVFTFQWQSSPATGPAVWTDIPGPDGTNQLFTPTQAQVGRLLRVVVTYTDDGGTVETLTSNPTDIVGDLIVSNGASSTLNGTAGADEIFAGGGADNVNGLAGNDILNGENGNDTIDGGLGSDTMSGGLGNDTFIVDNVGDTVIEELNEGTDTVRTSLNAYTLSPNVETLIFTGVGNFAGTGNAINNTINGNGGADTLSGAGGNDTLNGNAGADTLNGDGGDDTLNGGTGNDILTGGIGTDEVNGGADNDRLVATVGDGNDAYDGGGGTDTYDLSATTAGATITTNAASSTQTGTDSLTSIENFIGSQGNDVITVNGANNVIDGQDGNDTVNAGGGTDTVSGGIGNDTLNGGTGNDALNGGAGNDTFTYNFGDGADAIDGGDDSDTLNIIGTAAASTLDVVFNGTSLIQFEGGTVTGVEAVNANLQGGTDTLSYAGSTAGVTVNLLTGTASGFASITSIENVTGGSNTDLLTGNNGVNTLNGGAGNDILDGGLGNDTLIGGLGDDTYFANNGDTITEGGGAGSGTDLVSTTSATFTLDGNVENLTYTGAGNFTGTGNGSANVITGNGGTDTLNGNGGADTLVGNGGTDTLNGGGGSDILIGGAGNDVMNGGAGNDTFVFAAGFGNDSINQFDANPGGGGQDLLDLTALGITAADFAAHVTIADVGANILITVDGVNTITLLGVSGNGNNAITQADFLLA